MNTVVVANPAASAGRVLARWPRIEALLREVFGPLETQFTSGPGQATSMARNALRSGAERIVAVGGDGTNNEVVNGFFDPDSGTAIAPGAVLATYPVGTGGDFVRSIGLSGKDAALRFHQMTTRTIDVGHAELIGPFGEPVHRFFLNISSFGSSGLIVEKVNRTSKRLGGKAAFLWGTLKGLFVYRNQKIELRIDDVYARTLPINTVAVANGRYFGGSMKIAPQALLNDGLFDVTIVGDVGLLTFLRYSSAIYAGTHIGRAGVESVRGKKVTATPCGKEPVLIDLDGEQPGRLPVTYEIVPKALVVEAPWQFAEGVSAG